MKSYGTVRLVSNVWLIKAEPHILLRIKRVFSRIDKNQHGAVHMSNSPETCRDIEWFMERYPLDFVDAASKTSLEDGSRRYKNTVLRLEQIIDPNYKPQLFTMAVPPRDYQAREAELVLTHGFLLNADVVGLGKTAMSICTLTHPRTLPALVVTMTHLPRQWESEIHKFAPSLHVHIIKQGTPYELPKFFGKGPDVLIINYHKLSGWANVLGEYVKSVIFDEIQEVRHNTSSKYAAAKHVADHCQYRTGLSATPIFNYGGEIYNIMECLKPGILGTRAEFEREWCKPAGNGQWLLKDAKAFGTYARANFFIVRHTREDVGRELPPIIRVRHEVDINTEVLEGVEDSAMELANIILKQGESIKNERWEASQQLTNMLRHATGVAKAAHVADFVKLLLEAGESVVLFGWHREVYSIWNTRLKDYNPLMYTGSETPMQKLQAADAFINKRSPLLIVSLRSGAGLDGLQKASSVCVFGELDWSPAVHEQCLGRLARDGQKASVMAYFLVADDGADPVIAEVLGLKREQLEGIRAPDSDVIEELQVDPNHVRKLAEYYLTKRKTLTVSR